MPLFLGRFVGRAADVDAIDRSFRADERLVAIMGVAGIGKTRLAIEVGKRLLADSYVEELWFCDLSEIADRDAAVRVIARVLGVALDGSSSDDSLMRIAHALAMRGPALLVLDHFEQLLPTGRDIPARVVAVASNVRVLTTSRERLGFAGELVHSLGPLSLEAAEDGSSSEAVALLVDRAGRLGWSLDARGTTEDLARIARRLEGIPLALELAAARVAILGAASLRARLDEDFSALAPRGVGRPLDRALHGSFESLDAVDRSAMAQLTVFRGGFDLDAAEAVLDLGGASALDALESLVNKSLVRTSVEGTRTPSARFGLFVVIRDCAERWLSSAASVPSARDRHAAYYAARGEAAMKQANAGSGQGAREVLVREFDNLLEVAERARDARHRLRAILALGPMFSARGPRIVGRDAPLTRHLVMLDAVLEDLREDAESWNGRTALAPERSPQRQSGGASKRRETDGDEVVCLALVQRGDVLRRLGIMSRAELDFVEAERLAGAIGQRALAARAALGLAGVSYSRGELELARERHEAAIALLRAAGDEAGEASALSILGDILAHLGEGAGARACAEAARDIFERLGNQRDFAIATSVLGSVVYDLGDLDVARLCFTYAEAVHEEMSDSFGFALTRGKIGLLNHRLGALDDARAAYDACLAVLESVGPRRMHLWYLGFRSVLAWELGDVERARSTLREAISALDALPDRRGRALFRAYLAAVEVARKDLDHAASLFSAAEVDAARSGDRFLPIAVELLRVSDDVARGHESRAIERIARARTPGPDGKRALDRSGDVALALRVACSAAGLPAEAPVRPVQSRRGLVIARDGAWFEAPSGSRVALERRGVLRRTMLVLATQRLDRPGVPIASCDLVASAWEGEQMLPWAAQNRLRVAIATLRKLGLAEVIKTTRDGYAIDAAIPVVFDDAETSG